MRRYIQGGRRGKEANRIERQAMRDPFLSEALEGFDRAKDNPVPHINVLRHKIRRKNQRRLNVFKYGGIAASFVFIIAFSVYFGLQKNNQSQNRIEEREAYKEYIEKNIVYPADETCAGVYGEVTLSFFIDETGRPYRITVIKSLCSSADKEAIRLIEEGPSWHTGKDKVVYSVHFKPTH